MEKNLKDSIKDTKDMPVPYKSGGFLSESISASYTKTPKLITALYMVTDIIDTGEPIRNKLRTLGTEIISDIHNPTVARTVLANRVDEIMSFLDIASSLRIISEMNCSILKKEFLELKSAIQESAQAKPLWLEEFLKESPLGTLSPRPNPLLGKHMGHLNSKGHRKSIGHQYPTRIGVQKGSTLMQALSDKISVSQNNFSHYESEGFGSGFNILKQKRREDILGIIKTSESGFTITDIKNKAKGLSVPPESIISCSEKTLQRELVSMVQDNVLYKTGNKRWSRYFVK